MLRNLLISAQTGRGGGQQSSQQMQQDGSGPGLMSLLSKASKSGHSAVVSGAMALVSAYRARNRNRKRAMRQALVGVALMGFGLWQLRRKGKSMSQSGGSGGGTSGGQQQRSGGQQSIQ